MSNWHPKPLRPQDPNPLAPQDDSYTIVKSSTLTPLQRQRLQDGTPHTRGSQYHIQPTQATQSQGPCLYIGDDLSKSVSKDSEPVPVNVDAIVKSFLAKGKDDDDEDLKAGLTVNTNVGSTVPGLSMKSVPVKDEATEKGVKKLTGISEKIGAAASKVVNTAASAAGRVGSTVVGLATKN